MQAFGPGPPLPSSAGLNSGRGRAIPGQDNFQAHLQGRLLTSLGSPQGDGTAGAVSSEASALRGAKGAPAAGRPLPPEQYAEILSCLMLLGVPPEQARRWLGSAAGAGAPGGGAETRPLPALLQDFLNLIEQAPGQTLKIPPSRRPEVAALLLAAGLSRNQVERLLSSPTVQEQGLTVQTVKAAWSRSGGNPAALGGKSDVQAPAAVSDPGLAALTSHPAYRRCWDRLAVPQASLQDLRGALQGLGLSPQALAGLEEQAQNGPIPLSHIVKLLRQADSAGPSPASAGVPPETAGNLGQSPPDAPGVDAWLKLLAAAGLPPPVAQTLLGRTGSGQGEDLKARLAALEPPAAPPPALEAPKPLYLTPDLRLRAGFPQGEGNGWARRFLKGGEQGEPSKPGPGAQTGGMSAPAPETASFLPPTAALAPSPAAATPLPAGGPQGDGWSAGPAPPPYLTAEVREGLWSQIQAGVVHNLRPGENQVSLNLNPPELGSLQLTLNLKGRFVEVVAVAARPEVAQLAAAEVHQLVQALNQQGLILSQFQVQVQEAPGRTTVLSASGHRDQGRREAASDDRGPSSSRRRAGKVDFFV